MRLWHIDLIPHLPRQQLLGQHRECCALRGNGWGKKHATVDYVFTYAPIMLYDYHSIIMEEMHKRGYQPDTKWYMWGYRGKECIPWTYIEAHNGSRPNLFGLYPEHNDNYLQECVDNLVRKGMDIKIVEVENESGCML